LFHGIKSEDVDAAVELLAWRNVW